MDLANSIRKAGSTAATFNVTLDELVGYTTAISSTTRESGNIVGNSLKTIFARLTNNSQAVGALNDIGISINDVNGNLKPTGDIIAEIAGKWNGLSDAERQNTAVKGAGIYQLSRFTALMNNFSIAQSASETSANSFGSALSEQEKYSESLQARLNRLSNAFTTLAVSAGDALISDTLILATEGLGNFLQSAAKITDVIGFLPIILGTAGMAVALFSKNIRGMAAALITGNVSISGSAAALFGLEAGMGRAAIATAVLKTALRGLLISTGVGIAFAALGFVVEKLANFFADAKQKQEEFEKIQNTTVDSLTANKESTDELLASYQKLTDAKTKGEFSSDDEQEYLRVQQQLATLLPTLVDHYDSQGNAILKTGEALEAEIEYTKELVRQKKELQQIEAQENISKAQKSANKIQGKIDNKEARLENDYGINGAYLTDSDKKKLEIDITELKRQYVEEQMKIREELQKTVDSYFTDVTIDTSISAKVKEVVSTLDVDDKSAEDLDTFAERVSRAMIKMQEAAESNNSDAFSKAQAEINSLLGSFKDVDGDAAYLRVSFDDAKNSVKGLGDEVASQKTTWDENGEVVSETADAVQDLSDKIKDAQGDFASLSEIIKEASKAGDYDTALTTAQKDAYEALSDEIEPLNGLLQTLSEGKSISAHEAMGLISKEKELAGAISIENGQVKINEDAVIKLRNSKVKSYKDMLDSVKTEALQTTNATLAKLKDYGIEIKAISSLAEAKQRLKDLDDEREIANSGMGSWDTRDSVNQAYDSLNSLANLADEIDSLSEMASQGLNQVGTSAETMSNSTDSANSSSESANKTTEESIYITDKYKQSLERLNLELAKLQSKKNDYAPYSKKYQNALKQEIKLIEEQIKLNKQQTSELNAQIKSGNIIQTGSVQKNSSNSSSYSGEYSSYISKASSKYGVDANLIASIIKQESNFNANARSSAGAMGLMQLMPGTAKELGVSNAYDAYQNIMGGTKYISQLLDKYNGSVEKALWAYNAGMGNVNNIVNSSANEWKGAKSYASKVLSYFEDYGGAVQASTAKATKAIDGFSGTITSTYGTRTRNGKTETHRGIDIAGNKGDKIGATTAGTVTYAGWGKSGTGYGNYGNVVAVTAADGKTYLYAHLDATKVKKGDKVGVNQTIGTMGNTGDSDGVHLHYEVRTNGYGTDINPMSSVQAARNGTYTGSAADQASAIDGAKSEVNQLAQDALSLEDQIEELNMALVESVLAGYDHNKNQWEDDLAQIDLIQSSVSETDKKWIDQQLKKESIVRKQLEQEQLSIAYLKDQIKHNKALTEAQKAQLSDDLLQRTQDMISLEQQLLDERTQMADTIIDTYKQSLEAIKDAQLKQIDEIIDGINKEADEADYAKQLGDAQKDRQATLDEMSKLALSSSPADKAKLAELQKQLAEQDESIADMQTDRAKELRIDNLNEQKDDIQTNYDNLVNDEKKFAQMRSDIINANTKQIEKDLGKYYTNIKSNTSLLGKAMSNNLIDLINQANRYLNGKDYKPIKIASAAKGGILPSWGNEGKAMVVHEEEMISTKHDTKNLLAAMSESSKLMDTLKSLDMGKTLANASMNLLTSFKLPSVPTLSPSTSSVTTGATYNINMNIDKVTGDQNGVKTLLNGVVNGVRKLGGNI